MTTQEQDPILAELEAALVAGTVDLDELDIDGIDLPADLSALTIDDFTAKPAIENQRYREPPRVKILAPKLIAYEHAQTAADEIWPLQPGERHHAVVNGTFIFGDLFEAAAKRNDWLIDELWIATLSLSLPNVESLVNLYVGNYLRDLHLLVNDMWYAHNRGPDGILEYAYEQLDRRPEELGQFQLSVTCSHAKIALIGLATGERYVLHGSANLRSSASIEAFTVEHDPELYRFHRAWLSALEAQYQTINHTIPNPSNRRTARKTPQWQDLKSSVKSTTTANAPARPR